MKFLIIVLLLIIPTSIFAQVSVEKIDASNVKVTTTTEQNISYDALVAKKNQIQKQIDNFNAMLNSVNDLIAKADAQGVKSKKDIEDAAAIKGN